MKTLFSKLKQEFLRWEKIELFFFLFSFLLVFVCSIIKGDEILAIIASVFGIIYTFTAGKGKIYCYFFGIISTIACGYISFRIALWGTALLYFLYYLPMEFWGIFSWKKHLIKDSNEIIKTGLSKKGKYFAFVCLSVFSALGYCIFKYYNDSSPLIDSLVVVFSICAMVLTVKRCIEQWLLWTIVNILSIYMWFEVYQSGEKTFSILIIRIIYFILGIYFFLKWRKSLKLSEN